MKHGKKRIGLLPHLSGRADDAFLIGEIGRDGKNAGAFFHRLFVQREHAVARPRQRRRDSLSHAARRAGDQHRAAVSVRFLHERTLSPLFSRIRAFSGSVSSRRFGSSVKRQLTMP